MPREIRIGWAGIRPAMRIREGIELGNVSDVGREADTTNIAVQIVNPAALKRRAKRR